MCSTNAPCKASTPTTIGVEWVEGGEIEICVMAGSLSKLFDVDMGIAEVNAELCTLCRNG